MPATFDRTTQLLNRNGGVPRCLRPGELLVAPGPCLVNAIDELETASASGDEKITGPWTVLAAGSSRAVGAGALLAYRGTGTGITNCGITWT